MQNMLIHDHTPKMAADTSFIINKLPTFLMQVLKQERLSMRPKILVNYKMQINYFAMDHLKNYLLLFM